MIKIIIVITAPDKQERKDVEDTYRSEETLTFVKCLIINFIKVL